MGFSLFDDASFDFDAETGSGEVVLGGYTTTIQVGNFDADPTDFETFFSSENNFSAIVNWDSRGEFAALDYLING
jgi:hypothetical protein